MLPFVVTIPGTVPQRSGIPEGLTNYPVLKSMILIYTMLTSITNCKAQNRTCDESRNLSEKIKKGWVGEGWWSRL